MLKYSKSKMHSYKVLTFFRGKSKSENSIYKYDESVCLFAEENLASNLIEYDAEDVLSLAANFEIKNIINNLNKTFNEQRLNVVLVRLVDGILSDIEVEYDKNCNDFSYMENIFGILEIKGNFKLSSKNIDKNRGVIQSINKEEVRLFIINVSNDFYKMRKNKLSECLEEAFDPERYVDTSVAMFLLMAALPNK